MAIILIVAVNCSCAIYYASYPNTVQPLICRTRRHMKQGSRTSQSVSVNHHRLRNVCEFFARKPLMVSHRHIYVPVSRFALNSFQSTAGIRYYPAPHRQLGCRYSFCIHATMPRYSENRRLRPSTVTKRDSEFRKHVAVGTSARPIVSSQNVV